MKRFRLSLLVASISSLFMSSMVFAAAFQFYELGSPIIGTAAVGQTVVASDASISYFNPAGMTQLQKSQFMLGSQLILPYTNFSANSSNTISGNNGNNAGTLTPGLDMYYVYSYSPKLKLGLSFTSPYGGALNYNDGWVGRYNVQSMQFYTLNLNPSVAYKINECISIGAGVAVEYANLSQTVALPTSDPLVDGQVDLKLNNTSAGVNVGILFTPQQTTKIGIAYRSQINHNLTGNTTFLRISSTPSTSTRMIMPQNVIASISQDITDKLDLLGELGWSNWASMRDTVVHIAGFSVVTPQNWNDTYRVGLAAQYKVNQELLLHAGASFDSSPTTTSKRLPDLPMDRQIRAGLGLVYSMLKSTQVGFSYEYINFGNANINSVSSQGVLSGSYSRNYANVFQASVNVSC